MSLTHFHSCWRVENWHTNQTLHIMTIHYVKKNVWFKKYPVRNHNALHVRLTLSDFNKILFILPIRSLPAPNLRIYIYPKNHSEQLWFLFLLYRPSFVAEGHRYLHNGLFGQQGLSASQNVWKQTSPKAILKKNQLFMDIC